MMKQTNAPVATPNQLVAENLKKARELRGWTQEEAAEKLEPYLDVRWSKATFSAAERSVAGERIRQFDADEIFAFSQAFDLPIGWFFLPSDVRTRVAVKADAALNKHRAHAGTLLDLAYPPAGTSGETAARVIKLLDDLPANLKTARLKQLAKEREAFEERMTKVLMELMSSGPRQKEEAS